MKYKTILLLLLIFVAPIILQAQDQSYMAQMIKNVIHQFYAMQASDFSEDEVIDEAASFIPPNGSLEESLIDKLLAKINTSLSISNLQNGSLIIEDNEFPTNSLDINYLYYNWPDFQNVNIWIEVFSVEDAEGKNILMDEEQKEKYRELGIIEDDFNFTMAGETNETLWLNRELKWDENLKIKGLLHISYPIKYESSFFDKSNKNNPHFVDQQEFTLLDIDRNILLYRVKGDLTKTEQIKKMYLNADNKPFISYSSIAIDTEVYYKTKASGKLPTDEEINKMLTNFDMNTTYIDQIQKVNVNGNIAKLILYKIKETNQKNMNFEIDYMVEF